MALPLVVCHRGADNTTLYYTTLDDVLRPYKAWRHVIGKPAAEDECLFTEDDELYYLYIQKFKSGKFLVVSTDSSETSEHHLVDLGEQCAPLMVMEPRTFGLR